MDKFMCDVHARADYHPDRALSPEDVLPGKGSLSNLLAYSKSVLASLVNTAVPPGLAAFCKKYTLSWKSALSPCGNYLALVQDSEVEISPAQTSNYWTPFIANCQFDSIPHLRKVAWSLDSALVAIASSSGDIQVFAAPQSQLLCTIASEKNTERGKPLAVLAFVDIKRGATSEIIIKGSKYTHELFGIDYNGNLKSYILNIEKLRSESTTTDFRISKSIDSIHGALQIYHTHRFSEFDCVSCANYDNDTSELIVLGTSKDEFYVAGYTMLLHEPFYKHIDAEDGNSKARRIMNRTIPSLWRRLSSFFSPAPDLSNHSSVIVQSLAENEILITLNTDGEIALWSKRNYDLIRKWTSREIYPIVCAREKLASSDDVPLVTCIGRWSEEHIAIGFSDGITGILRVTSMTNALEDNFYQMKPCPYFQCSNNASMFILECTENIEKYRVRGKHTFQLESRASVAPDDDDEEENGSSIFRKMIGIVTLPLSYITDTFLWHWDNEGYKAQIVTITRRHFRSICLSRTTPLNSFHRKIESRQYEAALKLAERLDLDTDAVYKAQWSESEVSEESVKDFLDKIKNTEWVLNTTLERVPPSIAQIRMLLEYGKSKTNAITEAVVQNLVMESDAAEDSADIDVDVVEESNDLEARDLCRYRLVFLKYLSRLDTFAELVQSLKSGSDGSINDKTDDYSELFIWFRDANIIDLALEYAVNENVNAIRVLLFRHHEELFPYRYLILESLPEVVEPSVYEKLLPEIDHGAGIERARPYLPREERDSVENRELQAILGWVCDHDNSQLLPPGTRLYDELLSEERLREWYIARGRQIDEACGFINNVLTLIKLAVGKGVRGLESFLDTVVTLSDYLYVFKGSNQMISLNRFEQLGDNEIMNLFLENKAPDVYITSIKTFVLPLLERIKSKNSSKPSSGEFVDTSMIPLYNYYSERSADLDGLKECCIVWDASKATAPLENRIVHSEIDLTMVTLKVAYSGKREETAETLQYLNRMFQCLANRKRLLELASEDNRQKIAELEQRVSQLDTHLSACELLIKYEMTVSLVYFLDMKHQKTPQRKFMVRLARVFKGKRRSESDWKKLLDDIITLQKNGILSELSEKEIYVEFINSALSSESNLLIIDSSVFHCAGNYSTKERNLPSRTLCT